MSVPELRPKGRAAVALNCDGDVTDRWCLPAQALVQRKNSMGACLTALLIRAKLSNREDRIGVSA